MRPFRFSGWMIVLMLMILAGVIIAIEETRLLTIQLTSGGESLPSEWLQVPRVVLLILFFMAGAGIIGYGALLILRRSGAARLSNTQTGPGK